MPSVLIFGFDGLQPAQVNLKLMPNLSALAAKGVTFANHHAAFPTVTRANVSSIVTGQHPGRHGLAATILAILGMSGDASMDGRVLEEALAGGPQANDVDWSMELHNTERELTDKVYRQQIKLS